MKDRSLNWEEIDIYTEGLVSSGPVALWHLKVKMQWKLWLHWSQFFTGGKRWKQLCCSICDLLQTYRLLVDILKDIQSQAKSTHVLPDFPLLPWCGQTLMQTNLLPWCLSHRRGCSSLFSTWPSFLNIIWIIKYRSMSYTFHPSLMKQQIHVPGFMGLKNIQESIKKSICLLHLFFQKLITLKIEKEFEISPF